MGYLKGSNNKGFTLIEIIVVLIILGVLAVISIPAYFSWIGRCQATELTPVLKQITDRMDACLYSKGIANNPTNDPAIDASNSAAFNACTSNISFITTQHYTSTGYSSILGDNIRGTGYVVTFKCIGNCPGGTTISTQRCPDGTIGAGLNEPGGAIAICSYLNVGSTAPWDGTRRIIGTGAYQGLF